MSLRETYADDELLRELAAMAPRPDADFAALLDERAATGFPAAPVELGAPRSADAPSRGARVSRGRRRVRRTRAFRLGRMRASRPGWLRLARPHWSPLAFGAVATILLVAVAAIALVAGGGGDGGQGDSQPAAVELSAQAPPTPTGGGATSGGPGWAAPGAPAGAEGTSGSAGSASSGPAGTTSSGPAGATAPLGVTSGGSGASGTSSGSDPSIAHLAQLAVAVPRGRFDAAAARVPQLVSEAGGTVLSSQRTAGRTADAASFALSVPVGRYEAVMAQLSALGRVDRRFETTEDVTASIATAEDRLGDLRAERDSVRRRLAATDDDARADALRGRLTHLRREIAQQRGTAIALDRRARTAPLSLTLSGRHAPASGAASGDDDRGGIAQGWHDAGSVLTAVAAVAIVALAVAIPAALVLALAWWTVDVTRRRRRERGLSG